jgi:hypothetical protein
MTDPNAYRGPKVHSDTWNRSEAEIEDALLALQDGLEALLEIDTDPDILAPMSIGLGKLIRHKRKQNQITKSWREEVEAKIRSLAREVEELKRGQSGK